MPHVEKLAKLMIEWVLLITELADLGLAWVVLLIGTEEAQFLMDDVLVLLSHSQDTLQVNLCERLEVGEIHRGREIQDTNLQGVYMACIFPLGRRLEVQRLCHDMLLGGCQGRR